MYRIVRGEYGLTTIPCRQEMLSIICFAINEWQGIKRKRKEAMDKLTTEHIVIEKEIEQSAAGLSKGVSYTPLHTFISGIVTKKK